MAVTAAGSVGAIEPSEVLGRVRDGAVLLDVRDAAELATGTAPGAIHVPRCELTQRIATIAPARDTTVLLICESGTRSLLAAGQLAALGFRDVRSVSGGLARWRREGLPTTRPAGDAMLDRERYARQLVLPEVGEAGQALLRQSRVALVGAGGLGSPAALYLAAAGVGHLTILDDDRVERSNLQRQILHGDADTGVIKIASARKSLQRLNPSVAIAGVEVRLDHSNARGLLRGHGAVIDGSDNFETRYAVNDACIALGIPNVHGSVYRFEGQVSVFWPAHPGAAGPCYRCLYPEPPPPEHAPSCTEAGVLGIVPGVIGILQATEVLKLLLGIGEPLLGRMLHYDALQSRFDEFEVLRDPLCRACAGTT
jgi:molybdopterin/thiamine biosynthesis adenylyltransferase/rhodanese-related sulfurtransferase